MIYDMLSAAGHLIASPFDLFLHPKVQSGGGDLVFFSLIYEHLHGAIEKFRNAVLGRAATTVGTVALILMTAWIFYQGFRIIIGKSQESMMALVTNSLRATLIVTAAAAFGATGSEINQLISVDLQKSITHVVTGDPDSTPKSQIDKNLLQMQVAMSTIDAIQIVDNPGLEGQKKNALLMVTGGTAGPAMTGAAMLLLYEVALALFIGLGPFFILFLLWDSTKSLFHRWLLYGIGTMFSMAVLSAMVAIATQVVTAVSISFWATGLLSGLMGEQFSSGISSMAMQQGGLGLLLTVLLISTPPMAASFFQGTLGGFSHFSAWTGGSAPAGQRPGEGGYRGGQQSSNQERSAEALHGAGSQTGTISSASTGLITGNNESTVRPQAGARGVANQPDRQGGG